MDKISTVQELLESGIIEKYVLEQCAPDELLLVEKMAAQFPDVKLAIYDISIAFENDATANAIAPHKTLKPFVMATLNFVARMEAGEQPSNPPLINTTTTIADFEPWLSRPDLQFKPELFDDMYAYIIGHNAEAISAIVWIAPETLVAETHHNELEQFFILEGSCCISFNNTDHHLQPGDMIAIPLHVEHTVRITSAVPCKIILQRMSIAA